MPPAMPMLVKLFYVPIIAARHGRCSLTSSAAARVLGLDYGEGNDATLSAQQLRSAYLKAAKECHPDTKSSCSPKSFNGSNSRDFRQVTEAYELLKRKHPISSTDEEDAISDSNETIFRQRCLDVLGLSAEQVEESKRNPGFRQWLQGKTDAAVYWRSFLAAHGGLAPMLTRQQQQLDAGAVPVSTSRRKRRR